MFSSCWSAFVMDNVWALLSQWVGSPLLVPGSDIPFYAHLDIQECHQYLVVRGMFADVAMPSTWRNISGAGKQWADFDQRWTDFDQMACGHIPAEFDLVLANFDAGRTRPHSAESGQILEMSTECGPNWAGFRPNRTTFGPKIAKFGLHSTNIGPMRIELGRARPRLADCNNMWPEFDQTRGQSRAEFDQSLSDVVRTFRLGSAVDDIRQVFLEGRSFMAHCRSGRLYFGDSCLL